MKHKPRKSVMKRFKLTKNGKLLFRSMMGRHLRRKKSKGQQRRVKVLNEMTKGTKARIRKML